MTRRPDAPPSLPGYALPMLMLESHRAIIDELHAGLARAGHPDVRPAFGYTLQAVGRGGATAAEVGRRLGISKQAAAKSIDQLVELGYLVSEGDAADARRKILRVTERGVDLLRLSARGFEEIRARWVAQLGAAEVVALERALVAIAGSAGMRLDIAGWLGL